MQLRFQRQANKERGKLNLQSIDNKQPSFLIEVPVFATCAQAISTLRNVLWKHDIDSRYQDPVKKQRVASIYFPYILMVASPRNLFINLTFQFDLMKTIRGRSWNACTLWHPWKKRSAEIG